jgi:uncharacterized protein (DUF2384 family)
MSGTPLNLESGELTPPFRIVSISARAGEVFANKEKALHWLRSPNPSLEGMTPLEAAETNALGHRPKTQLFNPRVGHLPPME